ncbi:MAG TPA: hypothetical protein PKK00_10065 [Bacteroidales bacterium]|nr:hypothetical protein [Bacteroidales bacterium]HPS17681.1 hypothetical protein [Bacteroidales bacterium]
MKKILIAIFILLFTYSFSNAQKKIETTLIPKEIIKNFNTKFTSVEKVVWRKIDVLYEAEVSSGNKVFYATYEANGNLIETLIEMKVSDLPAEVVTGVHNLFSSAKIKTAALVEQSSDEPLYIVQFKYKGKQIEITFDKNGKQA